MKHVNIQTTPSHRRPMPAINAARRVRLALISMPFYTIERPSLQLALLKAIAEQRGFATSTFHFNLDFAVKIGQRTYDRLCDQRDDPRSHDLYIPP